VGVDFFGGWNHDLAFPDGFKQVSASTSNGPLINDAEVGRIYMETPLPSEWKPDEVDVKRRFPLRVSFYEPLPVSGVLEVLGFCLWGVEAVLTVFEPVFNGRQPPMPVTAIPNIG
jgi:hypothetical protein